MANFLNQNPCVEVANTLSANALHSQGTEDFYRILEENDWSQVDLLRAVGLWAVKVAPLSEIIGVAKEGVVLKVNHGPASPLQPMAFVTWDVLKAVLEGRDFTGWAGEGIH